MDKQQYLNFLHKYTRNEHTSMEHSLFLQWFHSLSEEDAAQVTGEYLKLAETYPEIRDDGLRDMLVRKIESRLDRADRYAGQTVEKTFRWGNLLKYAAALLVLAGAAIYLFLPQEAPVRTVNQIQQVNDVDPGGNRAVLTLSDGRSIALDRTSDGTIAEQTGVNISKEGEGQLVYRAKPASGGDSDARQGKMLFNTVTTPRGGQYRIKLPDGTKVWLNAHSSIRFPAVFGDGPREVEISGEVYFEVAHLSQTEAPFRVKSNGQVIEVLGTHFNVRAYAGEAVTKTTLAEGSVKVWTKPDNYSGEASYVKLRPGEQSLMKAAADGSGASLRVSRTDVEAAIAWKNGYFKFSNTPLPEVMQQLERWYDVKVVYQGKVPAEKFTGFVSRDVKISNVLKMLEQGGGVKFQVENRTISVRGVARPGN